VRVDAVRDLLARVPDDLGPQLPDRPVWETEGDKRRLHDWVNSQPRLRELLDLAFEMEREARDEAA
jgi:hypothetical protein